mmetsp:Transcript_95185/g.188578  ORF Transcript_95185/g.188578 Transcript_95185/m.188578 type:complete len:243 (+) Transcript_95185:62-790(+)
MALSFALRVTAARFVRPVAFTRTFASRLNDNRFQPGGGGPPIKTIKSSMDLPNLSVAEVTPAQTEASKAKKSAQGALVAAKQALADVAVKAKVLKQVAAEAADAEAKVLKRVAAEAADAEQAALENLTAKQADLDQATLAKKKADDDALTYLENAKAQNKQFLANAFDHFDTEKTGVIKQEHIPGILREIGYPAGHEEVEELMGAVDHALDGTMTRKAWIKSLPLDIKNALQNHPDAQKWSS